MMSQVQLSQPSWGTGAYEWQGFLSQDHHPHTAQAPNGRMLNWNNQSAPGFMHGDNEPYGSVHRVELFDQFPDQVGLTEDLRSLLGQPVEGEFNLSYCGNGNLDICHTSLWLVVDAIAQELAAKVGNDPCTWPTKGARTGFAPGLIPNTFRATNRPTFQQVLEFAQ
jgi:Penicillin amidase